MLYMSLLFRGSVVLVIMLVMLVVDVLSHSLPVRALSSNVLSWAPFCRDCTASHTPVSVHVQTVPRTAMRRRLGQREGQAQGRGEG